MRSINSIKNVIVSVVLSVVTILFNFVTQSIFISTLGMEYSGLNNVFTSIISVLSIVELGIGSSIIYHLYKPIYENDILTIKSLMNFYKKAYRIIAIVVFVLGTIILPCLPWIVDVNLIKENVYFLFFLYVIDSVSSYLLSYKRSIIYANQKNRIIDLVHLLYVIVLNAIEIFILVFTKNFILYLIIKIIFRILENVIIGLIADYLYPYLKDKKNIKKISKNIQNEIKKMVKGQLFHQIASTIVISTDSMLVSSFFGLKQAGIYANYTLIANSAHSIISQIFSVLTASIGNLLVENNEEKSFYYYKLINYINFLLYALSSIGMFFCIDDFIILWLGDTKYIFPIFLVFVFSFNFFLQGMRKTIQVFAIAAGICYENRFVPVLEAIINLIASLLFLNIFGIVGIVLGTVVSTFVLYFYGFPKYIYSPLFKKNKTVYIKEFLYSVIKYLFIFFIESIVIYSFNFLFDLNIFIELICNFILCILIFIVLILIIDWKSDSRKEIIQLLKTILKR